MSSRFLSAFQGNVRKGHEPLTRYHGRIFIYSSDVLMDLFDFLGVIAYLIARLPFGIVSSTFPTTFIETAVFTFGSQLSYINILDVRSTVT